VATLVTGLVLAQLNGYLVGAITLGLTDAVDKHTMIGIGMWLGTIMWFNVWFLIWPNQKRVLGLGKVGVEADAASKARAARTALIVSRLNTGVSQAVRHGHGPKPLLGTRSKHLPRKTLRLQG